MRTLLKAVAIAALAALSFATSPATAQNYYRTLDGTSGCIIDVGRTAPPNSAYAYTYTLRNQCDQYFTIYFEVDGRSMSGTIARNGEWGYPVANGQSFQLTAVEG